MKEAAARPERVPTTFKDELIWVHAKQSRIVPIAVSLHAAPMAIPFFGRIPTSMVVGWLGLLVATSAIFFWIRRLRRRRLKRGDVSYRKRFALSMMFTGAYGIILALPLVFFPHLTESGRLFESLILLGLWLGAALNSFGNWPLWLAFSLPSFVTLVAMWVFNPGAPQDGWFHYAVAATIVVFFGPGAIMQTQTLGWLRESFAMRLRQAELNRQLEAALAQAETANRAKTRFLASASHDLRQPIHTLSLFGAALSMQPLNDASREIARNMNSTLDVLASQLDALLDISKLDAKVVRVEPTTLKLHNILERLCQESEPTARAKGLVLTLDCPADSFIETDQLLFERIVRNLLDNAIKYTDKGHIKIDVARTDDDFVITIEDTGRGIPEGEQTRVFEEFYQLDNPERDRTRGLGLGLPIVRRLTELLRIRLDMESAPGRGTRFCLRLPAVESRLTTSVQKIPTRALPGALQVMVVDDEAGVRVGMKTLLESMACRVTLADGTAQALDLARANKPDVVLSDLRLRGADNGIETVRAIRKLYPAMPALLISGDIAPERLREAEAAGIPLLHKPVPVDVLKQAIAKAMG